MGFYHPKPLDTRNKKNAEIVHAQKRGKERLPEGVDVQSLARKIKNGESKFLYRESNRLSHHEIVVEGKPFEFVYDGKRGVIVTVLYSEKK